MLTFDTSLDCRRELSTLPKSNKGYKVCETLKIVKEISIIKHKNTKMNTI